MNCRVCYSKLTDDNWNPSTKKQHSYICRECDAQRKKYYYQGHKEEHALRSKQYVLDHWDQVREYQNNLRRISVIRTTDELGNRITIRCTKRPHVLICELCGKEMKKTNYHHWDNSNPNNGMWICNFCHFKAETIEDTEFTNKYKNLKNIIEEM